MAEKKAGTHDKCLAVTERDAHTLVCWRSPGHVRSNTARRRLHYAPGSEIYWFDPLHWVQIEPRRLYRTEVDGKEYNLGYRGPAAAPQAGWYLVGGLDGKGSVFMAKRLRDAAETAEQEIAQFVGEGAEQAGLSSHHRKNQEEKK